MAKERMRTEGRDVYDDWKSAPSSKGDRGVWKDVRETTFIEKPGRKRR